MRKAVVLGGGGPVGIGWEAGLLVGLKRSGVDLSHAEAVVGTSAGSVVGFTLSSGGDLTEAVSLVGSAAEKAAGTAALDPSASAAALEFVLSTLANAATDPAGAQAMRARVGQMALQLSTMSEETWLEMFEEFAGAEWPANFRCTAVDAGDGTYQVWDSYSGVDVQRALASSCAVPGVFPPVSIGGRRWMDGGVRDMLNADAGAGHEIVVAVSCTILEVPEGFDLPGVDAMLGSIRARLDALTDEGAKVEIIVPGPEMLEISEWGLNLMDFARAGAAYEAGLRQGEELADSLSGLWGA
jgi:NTE family protein